MAIHYMPLDTTQFNLGEKKKSRGSVDVPISSTWKWDLSLDFNSTRDDTALDYEFYCR